MTITLELPPDVEAKLRGSAARNDAETVRRLLTEAVAPTVAALLNDTAHGAGPRADGLTDAEFDALADELAAMTPELPALSDAATRREAIYAVDPARV